MSHIISLYSRDNHISYLEQIDTKKYTLKTDSYIRIGVTNNNCVFLDPAGGPMLIEGTYLGGTDYYIKSIQQDKDYGYIITLK